jgi:hypothetical protein
MKTALLGRALIGAVAILSLGGSAERRLFPKEVYSAGGGYFNNRLHVKPMWETGAARPYRQRVRMLISGIRRTTVSVELDQRVDGRWTGALEEHDGEDVVNAWRFDVSPRAAEELSLLIREAGLWSVYPEFRRRPLPENEICLDGENVIFEKADDAGYRYSEGNAQCDLGERQIAVAAKMLELAHRKALQDLLE